MNPMHAMRSMNPMRSKAKTTKKTVSIKKNTLKSRRQSKKNRIFGITPPSITKGETGVHPRIVNIDNGDFLYCTFNETVDQDVKYLMSDDELSSQLKVLDNKFHHEKDIRDIINFSNEYRNSLCTGISESYTNDAVKEADIILTLRRNRKNNIKKMTSSKVIGFVLLVPKFKLKTLYIDLICSSQKLKGGGQILLDMAEKIAKTLQLDSTSLKAVRNEKVISFYEKNGYIKNPECMVYRDRLCEMQKRIDKTMGNITEYTTEYTL